MNATNKHTSGQNAVQERLILEAANEYAIFTTDLQRRVMSWNTGAENLFGHTKADILGQLSDVLYLPEDREQADGRPNVPQREAEKTLREGRADNERWHLRKNGTLLYGSGVVTPLRDEAGTIIGLVKVVRDLTRQKQAEETLRASEERQAFLVKLGDALRPLTDPVEIQATAARLLGLHLDSDRAYYVEVQEATNEFVVARDWHQPGAPSHAGRYSLEDWPIPWLIGGKTWVVHDTTTDPAMPDDQRASYLANDIGAAVVVPFIKQGRLVATFVTNQRAPRPWTPADVSLVEETAERTWAAVERARAEKALAASEEKYRTLFNSIDEGFCIFELLYDKNERAVDYRFMQINPVFERQTGLKDATGRLGSEIAPGTETHWLEAYDHVVRTGEPLRLEDYNRATGRWYEVYASRVGDMGNRQVCTVFNDVTERKRHEANLAFLAEVSQDLAGLTNIDETMNALGEKIAAHLGLSATAFAELQEAAQIGVIKHGWHRSDMPSLLGTYRMEEFVTPEVLRLCRAGEAVVIRDVFDDSRTDGEQYAALNVGSFVSMPLVRDGEWRFLLVVYRSEPHDWRKEEIDLLRELTTRIWTRLERARAEEALARSEEKYRAMFESLGEGVSILDVQFSKGEEAIDYRFVENNPAVEQMTGVGNSTGKTVLELFPDFDRAFIRQAGEVARSGEPVRFQHFVPALGRWFDVHETRIGGVGSTKIIAAFADITENKRREASLAFLAEVSQDLVHLTNIDETMDVLGGKIGRHFNVAHVVFAEISEDQQTGRVSHEWHQPDLSDIKGSYATKDYFSPELERLHLAGEIAVVRDTAKDERVDAERYAALGVGAFVGVPLIRQNKWRFYFSLLDSQPHDWRDNDIELMGELATRIWTRLERARAETAVHEANRRKDEFLAMLSHELRNPLATIVNTLLVLELTQGADASLSYDKAVGLMSREANHLNRMVDDLLDLSRIRQGKIKLERQRIDLGQIVDQTVEAAQPLFQERNRQLALQLPTSPLYVHGDATRLAQVVMNLLTNGVKFTAEGGNVWVSLEASDRYALLRVKDDGMGIPRDELKAIFEVFVQGNTSLDRPQGGLGLGLAVVKQLVEGHEGRLEAFSDGPGQGSEFRIELPLLNAPSTLNQWVEATPDSIQSPSRSRVLVVDDNKDLADMTAKLIQLKDYEVHTRYSGQEALEAAETLRPDAILLDIGMPHMDGYTVCEQIRRQPWGQSMVLIAMTGYGQEADKQRSRAAGFDDHLLKPIDYYLLIETLARYTGS